MNSGVGCVTGKVKLDTNDLDASFFDLSIYPADEIWEHVLNSEATLPSIYVPRTTDRSLLTFKSTQHSEDRERQIGSHRESYIDSRGAHRHCDAC